MTLAITGANGYAGGIICAAVAPPILRLVRKPQSPDDLAWSFDTPAQALAGQLRDRGVAHIIHAAWDMRTSRLEDLEKICVAGSARLLEAASLAGISGLTFISTISAFDGARSAYGQAKRQVERQVLAAGGNVLRPGLIQGAGGMFESLRNTVSKSNFIPLIGNGATPQYLLPEARFAAAIRRSVTTRFSEIITLADPTPVPFRTLLQRIAAEQDRSPTLIPIPWQFLYAALRTAEQLGLRPAFKSDSILSFIHQNPAPDFGPMQRLGL